ncbi:MAG: hypothetical protein RLY71_3418 [Pseudomonadota bacterium]|jgi:hypothetical protein
MKTAITFTVDTDTLRGVTDSHLHALWHIAQANPAPMHDRDACALVGDLSAEIVRRWLLGAPVELYQHQATHHHWHTLVQHGNWRGPGGTWLPHDSTSRDGITWLPGSFELKPASADACTPPAPAADAHNAGS